MISYKSQTYNPQPYIPPVDLNLLNSVLQFKETDFLNKANQIQQQIDSFTGLDVMKEGDREYLKSKINETKSKLNSYGGVDLTNQSVFNELSSVASQIGQDKNIVNAAASTRQIRSLMAGYEKMKMDPKMKGTYSSVNEEYDMQFVNSYLSDGKVGSSYSGPNSPTPYFDVDKAIGSEIKNMRANLTEDISNPGYYISKTTNERLSFQDVFEAAKQKVLTNPQALTQAQRNGWYFNKNRAPEQIVGELYAQAEGKLETAKEQLKYFEQQKALSVNNPEDLKNINTQISNLTKFLKEQKLYTEDLKVNGIKQYQENPERFNLESYVNNFANGVARIYSYNKTKRDVKADSGKMMENKITLDAMKSGFRTSIDPTTGKMNFIFDPSLKAEISGSKDENSVDKSITDYAPAMGDLEEQFRVTPQRLAEEVTSLNTRKQELISTYLRDISNYRPELKDMFTKQLMDEMISYGKGKNKLDVTLGPEDFEIINDPTSSKRLTSPQINFIKNAWEGWKAKAMGDVNGVKNLPEGMNELFSEVQEIDNKIKLNDKVISNGVKSLASTIGLSSSEAAAYEEFLKNRPDSWSLDVGEKLYSGDFDFTASIFTSLSPAVSKNLQRAFEKIYASGNQKHRESFWNNISTGLQPKAGYSTLPSKDKALQDYLFEQYQRHKPEVDVEAPFAASDIQSGRIVRNYDKSKYDGSNWVYLFRVENKSDGGTGKVESEVYAAPINDETAAQKFNARLLPSEYENIEREIDLNSGATFERVISNKKTGFSGTFVVAKRPFSGGFDIQVRYKDSNGSLSTKVLQSGARSAAEAYEFAKKFVQNYQGDHKQLLEELDKKLSQ